MKKLILLSISFLVLSGCVSTFGPEIGMTEKQWLRRTLIADVAYMEGNVKAYKSGGAYVYFLNGILVKVDQGMIPPQRIEMEVNSTSSVSSDDEDKYDKLIKLKELKENGTITEEEFETEKKKLLNQ